MRKKKKNQHIILFCPYDRFINKAGLVNINIPFPFTYQNFKNPQDSNFVQSALIPEEHNISS